MSNTAKYIEEAKKGLASLPDVLDLVALIATHNDESIKYHTENMPDENGCIGYPLLNTEAVAIQIAYMKKGAIFPRHTHKVTEWLIIYKGKLKFFNGAYQGKVLNGGDEIKIKPNTSHRVLAEEETWMVAITIPACEGYPK